jgi:flagellar motor switch protein FliG
MSTTNINMRKAAVLLRSLDGETAALMLAQLSREEAASIRAAIHELGSIDPDEQADVVAEFQRTRPLAAEPTSRGVELSLSSAPVDDSTNQRWQPTETATSKPARFEFLAGASTSALVRFLAREHAQTVAVVLAHLTPERAAAVLAELPERLQSESVDRLSQLGEADPESVNVLEQQLSSWLATVGEDRGTMARRRESVANILAAADPKTRRGILSRLKSQNITVAEQVSPELHLQKAVSDHSRARDTYQSRQATDASAMLQRRLSPAQRQALRPMPIAPAPAPLPRIEFEQLSRLDPPTLAAVMREVDATVLALALAGSGEELIDRVCSQMPKRAARAFRREVRRVGPTRLSDVEGAQRAVADAAALYLSRRRQSLVSA